LLLLVAGAAMALLAGLLYFFFFALTTPESARPPGPAMPATRPAATTPNPDAGKWVTGLTALQTRMNNAGPPSGVAVTPHSLRGRGRGLIHCAGNLNRSTTTPSAPGMARTLAAIRHAAAGLPRQARSRPWAGQPQVAGRGRDGQDAGTP